MNEFNRANTSARATDQAYIDEGLRAHMLRIYNYMTAALSHLHLHVLTDLSFSYKAQRYHCDSVQSQRLQSIFDSFQ